MRWYERRPHDVRPRWIQRLALERRRLTWWDLFVAAECAVCVVWALSRCA